MRPSYTRSLLGFASLALTGCGVAFRRELPPPACSEAQAAALDTTQWRRVRGDPYPSLILPPELVDDPSLVIICYHGGVMWSDSTAPSAARHLRFVGWCHEGGMPRTDAPDSIVRRILVQPMKDADGPLCQLSFPVFGQRMALMRRFNEGTGYEWITWPLEHGEPSYLFARSPSVADEAVVIRALQSMRWTR